MGRRNLNIVASWCRLPVALGAFTLNALGQNMTDLYPKKLFSVTNSIAAFGWQRLVVKEFQSSSGGLWFLADSKEGKGSAIIATGPEGRLLSTTFFAQGMAAHGLAATAHGAATLVFTRGTPGSLVEYSSSGAVVSKTAVQCGWSGLMSLAGVPGVICLDGSITWYAPAGPIRTPSWARPGALVTPVSANRLLIIDQETAQAILSDTSTSSSRPLSLNAPELTTALQLSRERQNAAQAAHRTSDPPLGNPLIVMSAASDASGAYLLLWPYNIATGPAAIKVNSEGLVTARYRLHLPQGVSSLHKIEVQDGILLAVSPAGDVFQFH